jgi:hypothetical protein
MSFANRRAGFKPGGAGFSLRRSSARLALLSLLILLASCSAGSSAEKLHGRWLRPDGGYILEIRDTKPGGSMTAAYFNPNSIRVEKAEWVEKDGKLNALVVMRDVNYPGSMYALQYVPEKDMLAGQYFQAIMQQTFEVVFTRAPEK